MGRQEAPRLQEGTRRQVPQEQEEDDSFHLLGETGAEGTPMLVLTSGTASVKYLV